MGYSCAYKTGNNTNEPIAYKSKSSNSFSI